MSRPDAVAPPEYTGFVTSSKARALVRRLARGTAGCLMAGAMLVPLGPTTTSQAVGRMNSMSTRPLPSAAPRPAVRGDMVWVPDRYVLVVGEPAGARVPGHWERITPDGQHHVPPVSAVDPSGAPQSFPSRDYPPPAQRPYGP